MAKPLFRKVLPVGKKFHLFLFHSQFSERDRLWVKDVVKGIEYLGYVCGSSDHYDACLSVYDNIAKSIEVSNALGFVISQNSVEDKVFINNIEIAVMYTFKSSKHDLSIVPILLDDCTVPNCLLNCTHLILQGQSPLCPSIIRVLESQGCTSSEGESDDDLQQLHKALEQKLANKDIRKQKKFRHLCQKSGISQLIGQMGTPTMHESLMKGCGVEIEEKKMILAWDRFDNIFHQSNDTLISIVKFNQNNIVRSITVNLTKEGLENFCRLKRDEEQNLVNFIEQSVNCDFSGDYASTTYNVHFQGHLNYEIMHRMNNVMRKVYLENFRTRSSEFTSFKKRKQTFCNWPHSKKLATILSKAGFIYSGEQNTVTCHSCNQSLYGVSGQTQTAYELLLEHCTWNSDCSFLRAHGIQELTSSDKNPYVDDHSFNLNTRIANNKSALQKHPILFKAEALAISGLVVFTTNESNIGIRCVYCSFMGTNMRSMDDVEKSHVLYSGTKCPHLVETIGTKEIEDLLHRQRRSKYTSSFTLDTVLIRADQLQIKGNVFLPLPHLDNFFHL